MHAAFVLPRFFPYRGGYENSILALSKHLVSRGHQVTVFTTVANDLEAFWLPGFRTFPEGKEGVEGITIVRFPICYRRWRRRAGRLLGYLPDWRLQAQFRRPSFRVVGLDRALGNVDADILHIGPLPYTGLMYSGFRAARARGIPVVATPCTHLGEEDSAEVGQHYLQPFQMTLLRHCDLVMCMTETELRSLEQRGVDSPKQVLPHGYDLDTATGGDPQYLRQRYNVNGPVVLHLGTKAFDKGSVTLLEAMRRLWQRGSTAWLVMAGPSLSAFEAQIAPIAKECPRLLNLPSFADAEKRDLLASATLVAQPSRVESLGHVLMEAWANATPVVAADIAVSRELVTRSNGGVLTSFGDADRLAQALAELLANAEMRQAMGAAGRTLALQYTGAQLWPRIAEAMEALAGAASAGRSA